MNRLSPRPSTRLSTRPARAHPPDELHITVATARGPVVAVLTWPTWQQRFGPCVSDASLQELYASQRAHIDAAVQARAERSTRKRVVLKPGDL